MSFGMATPSGFLASTGVAGLTLGGGIGYLSRRFGLTVDNLLSADVVLGDGTLVTASPSVHGDLFGHCAAAAGELRRHSSFTFRCHDIGEGDASSPAGVLRPCRLGEVMRWYRELIPSLPEELSGWIGLLTVPPVAPFPEESVGPQGRASSGATPDRTTGRRRCSSRSSRSAHRCLWACSRCYSACCRARSIRSTRPECSGTGGLTSSTRSPTRPSRCTASTANCCRPATPPCTCTPLTAQPPGSADATAFAYRDGGWAGIIVGVDPDPANAAHLAVGQGLLAASDPTSAGRRVRQLPDGRRPGPGQGGLPRQLRPARPDQGALRPGQHFPLQSEHPARPRGWDRSLRTWGRSCCCCRADGGCRCGRHGRSYADQHGYRQSSRLNVMLYVTA